MTESPEWRGERQGHSDRGPPAVLGLEARLGLRFYSKNDGKLWESSDGEG